MRPKVQHVDPAPLRAARERARLTLAELAQRAGIALSTLHLAERHGVVSDETAARIAAALGLKAEALGLPALAPVERYEAEVAVAVEPMKRRARAQAEAVEADVHETGAMEKR